MKGRPGIPPRDLGFTKEQVGLLTGYGARHTIWEEAGVEGLFDRGLRTDEGRREDNEGVFAFLDRSARPSSAKVRGLLTDWLSKPRGRAHQTARSAGTPVHALRNLSLDRP